MATERNESFDCYRAALSRYRAAWADLRAEIAAGTPPTGATLDALKDAEIALSAAWRAYVDADPLAPRTDSKATEGCAPLRGSDAQVFDDAKKGI